MKTVHPLQTKAWGKFREAWGNEVLFTKHGILTLHKIPIGPVALLGRKPLLPFKLGMFIRGPKPTKEMLVDLKKIAKENNLVFIKLEPNVITSDKRQVIRDKLIRLLRKNGCVPGKTLFTPTSFQIDLAKSEEELMKSFSSKTRYNIRLSERKGVKVKEDNSNKAFEKYIQLTRETVERQGFYAHTEKYHRLMWKYLSDKRQVTSNKRIAKLLTAKYKGETITTWILFAHDKFLYYPYGASSTKHKNVMANNLMMWEAIRLGKKLGCTTFDLWGREPGKGFTKFKEGYKPKVVEFVGTWDLVCSPIYYFYRVAEFFRWRILRLKSKFAKPTF